jgi:ubiquinone/menaquinone biosynthesis C-methylase UbiE
MYLERLFKEQPRLDRGVYVTSMQLSSENEQQTNAAFSEKWMQLDQAKEDDEAWKQFQFRWYLECYGYQDEAALSAALASRNVILDAGCGPGYKAAWFARLNPNALVIAMDLSDSIFLASTRYADVPNMIFVQGDISDTWLRSSVIDFINCDQVLHHTNDPPATVREFHRILASDGLLNTYVYAKKALPRELLDEHLRTYTKQLKSNEIWEMSDQLTQLGRMLAELKISIDVPDIPTLGIRGGRQDLQRFIYWNFIKCFWNQGHGFEASKLINYDWYAPSNAFRYTADEFKAMLVDGGFTPQYLRSEEACHTGRFIK